MITDSTNVLMSYFGAEKEKKRRAMLMTLGV